MEEDTEGIKTLIKQRNQRPCYARTISLEFSCTKHANPVSTQRKQKLSKKNSRKKSNEISDLSAGSENELDDIQSVTDLLGDHASNIETNEDDRLDELTSSSDSEYYSANESPSSESISDGSSSQIRDNLSELDFLLYTGSGNTDSISDSDSDSAFCSVNSSQHVHTQEKPRERQSSQSMQYNQRAPSKKQKRKRRLKSKTTFLNNIPFSGLENFECCISEVKNEITERVEEIQVMKAVPLLSDLCLLAAKNLGTKNAQTNVPYKIRQIFRDSNVKKNLQKFQLSSLYRHLAYCEQKNVFENNCLYKKNDEKQFKVLIPRRNIWDVHLHQGIFGNTGQHYNGSVPPCYIPYTFCPHVRYTNTYDEWYWDTFMVSRNCLAVYAATVDLMMPPVVKLPRQRKRQQSGKSQQNQEQMTEEEDTTKIIKNLTFRLKSVLNERFPTCTKHYFDMVLPYVFWARGDIGYAAEGFTDLAEKETRSRMKAMYLFEIGRMYSQFDDQERAKSCFRLAADAASSKSKQSQNDDTVIKEINRQTLMLTANAYDQGLMTAEKALLAFDNWKAGVISLQPSSLECHGIWSYMDSLLCYHAWSLENGGCSCFLKEAKTRISSLTKSYPELYYYLSMICAFEGNAQECSEAYRCYKFTAGASSDIGSELMNLNPRIMKYRSPWNILIDHISHTTTLKPLQVVWRTQLAPLIVADKKVSWESDMHSKAIKLRLSSEGYITGDMQMALPPMRGIYLDPYTGYLCFPHIPGDTEKWIGPQTDVFNDQTQTPDKTQESNLVVPTPTDLYQDNSGNIVHLMFPSMIQAMAGRSIQVQAKHMVLTWTGSDGQHARYNLLPKLQQMAYSDFINSLKNDSLLDNNKYPNWKDILTNLAQHCLSKGYCIDKNAIISYVKRNWGKNTSSKVKQQAGKKAKTLSKQKDLIKSFVGSPTIVLLGQIVVFNTNLCIPVNFHHNLYLVFVDCKNRTDFLNPVIIRHNAGFIQITQHPEFPQVLKGNQLLHADVMYCEMQTGDLKVFDNYGEVVDIIEKNSIKTEDGFSLPVIVDRNKICFLDNKSVRSVCNSDEEWAVHLGQVNKLKNIHNILVLLTDTGIKFADGRSFLPLPIMFVDGSSVSVPVSDDSMEIQGDFIYFSILHEESLTDYGSSEKYTRAVVALDNNLVILNLSEEEDVDCVKVLLSVALPGYAKEICFIGGNGFLVTVTQHISTTEHYRENLYYYDMNGQLKNYLLCLGNGPRSFLPVYLPGNAELQESRSDFGRMGWHVYMRDGHDGIICIYLHP